MILILGASSYLGRRLFAALGSAESIGTHKSHPVADSVYFDATRMRLPEILPSGSGVSHAIICYGETAIDVCKADRQNSREINVHSTKRLIDDLAKRGIKPIFFSSDNVFDGKNGRYSESDTAKPSTVYGSQKVEIEDYLQAQGHDHAVLRLARVFGTELTDGTILSSWMRQIQDGDEILCARDQVFSPIHVDDVISVAMAAARLDLSGTYHVCNPQAWSWLGMLRALAQSSGVEANIIECSIRDFNFLDDRPLDLSMDPAKVLAATGLSFRTVESCCEEICKAWKLGIPMGKATPWRFLA